MNTPLIGWVCIAAAMAMMIIAHIVKSISRHSEHHHSHLRAHHLIEIGSEREEFFVPGDQLKAERNDIDCTDEL